MDSQLPENQITFPIPGSKVCPGCGSQKGIIREYINQLKTEGKLNVNAYPHGFEFPALLQEVVNKTGLIITGPLITPVLLIGMEVCGKCFTMYSTNVDVAQIPLNMKMTPPPGPSLGL